MVVSTSCCRLDDCCNACSADIRRAVTAIDGEARSYGKQSQAGSCRISSSGAKYGTASATARMAASSGAMNKVRPFAALAKSANNSGTKPDGTEDNVSGDFADMIFCKSGIGLATHADR